MFVNFYINLPWQIQNYTGMFHTILILSYLIPNVYLFVRIWQLFIPKECRIQYVLIYALLFSVYPVSNMLVEGDAGPVGQILEASVDYLLPFFLYLFLFVLLTDLLLLINLAFKIIPRDKIREKSLRVRVLIVIICFSVTVVIAGIIIFNTIRTSEYQIDVHGRSSDISRLRIAFASDFHLQESTPVRFVERFVKEIGIVNPDLMLFGGDIVEGDREDENMLRFEKLFSQIKPKYGVFTVLGNHEFYAGQDKGSFFDKAGMTVLCDTFVVIDNSISLLGRYDSHFNTRKTITDLIQYVSDTLPVILIDHRPTEIDQVSKTRVNIQLSGHTHNGQLFPINMIIRDIYQLSWGYEKIRNTHFFVTSGIQLWGPPVRTAGKSEIMVIEITLTGN